MGVTLSKCSINYLWARRGGDATWSTLMHSCTDIARWRVILYKLRIYLRVFSKSKQKAASFNQVQPCEARLPLGLARHQSTDVLRAKSSILWRHQVAVLSLQELARFPALLCSVPAKQQSCEWAALAAACWRKKLSFYNDFRRTQLKVALNTENLFARTNRQWYEHVET